MFLVRESEKKRKENKLGKRASIFYGANLENPSEGERNMKNKQITMLARQLLFSSSSFFPPLLDAFSLMESFSPEQQPKGTAT